MTKRASPSKKRRIVAEFHRRLDKDQKSRTYIYEDLAGEHGVSSKTIQRWVTRADKQTKPTEPIPEFSQDGRLLV